MRLQDKINEIKESQENEVYVRGVQSLTNIEKNSIDVFDDYLQELAGGHEGIENRLSECGVAYSIEEDDNKIIIEYDGCNVSLDFDFMLTEQYNYVALVTGELKGENFHGDGDICKITKVVAILNKQGERIS